ncbi:MAG: sensor histidine kinase [Verrucomicrobiota bacterium]
MTTGADAAEGWLAGWLRGWRDVVNTPKADGAVFMQRVAFVERGVALPAKAVSMLVLLYLLFVSSWFQNLPVMAEDAWNLLRTLYVVYFCINVGGGIVIWGMNEVPQRLVEVAVYLLALVDALFVSALTLLTGGFGSVLYWLCPGLILRNAAVIPRADFQILLNIAVPGLYMLAGFLHRVLDRADLELIETTGKGALGAGVEDGVHEPVESLVTRMLLLLLLSACCYALQVLLDRKRMEEAEAREFALKEKQLQAAGRLAAEIAHQLKNPLGIINNAAYTLQKTVKEGKTITQQIAIIREEVVRSDRILTELMGYAQLAEGKVERVMVTDEIDKAVEEAFPAGTDYKVEVKRDYAPAIPHLLGQRAHFAEIFLNLLTNAREAMNGRGKVWVHARVTPDYEVEVRVKDSGPGVAPENLPKLFDAYFTTKEHGTGLGLAIVKHNAEMYGGSVRAESVLGQGATFVVTLPARSVMRLRR